jgi:hypothetical protein
MKTKKKNQKPIKVDAHFKYRCPDSSCGYDHWLSLKQTQTKNFKVVCDCGNIFKPQQIAKIKIIFNKEPKVPVKKNNNTPSVDLQNKCVTLLCNYGFTNDEALGMLQKAFDKNPTEDAGSLIKYILQNLGEFNVNN